MGKKTEDELRARVQFLESIIRNIGTTVSQSGMTDSPAASSSHISEQELLRTLPPQSGKTLEYFLAGYRVSTIAQVLGLSPHTIRNHLKAAFRKAGVHSQQELIEYLRPSLHTALSATLPGKRKASMV